MPLLEPGEIWMTDSMAVICGYHFIATVVCIARFDLKLLLKANGATYNDHRQKEMGPLSPFLVPFKHISSVLACQIAKTRLLCFPSRGCRAVIVTRELVECILVKRSQRWTVQLIKDWSKVLVYE